MHMRGIMMHAQGVFVQSDLGPVMFRDEPGLDTSRNPRVMKMWLVNAFPSPSYSAC